MSISILQQLVKTISGDVEMTMGLKKLIKIVFSYIVFSYVQFYISTYVYTRLNQNNRNNLLISCYTE